MNMESMESIEKMAKKGTTTVGVIGKDCVVLAADQRASMGNLVASNRTTKVYKVTDKIVMTMAGLAGDGQTLVRYLRSQLSLYILKKKKHPSVKASATLLSNILFSNRLSPFPFWVQLLLGGYDTQPYIYSLDSAGSMQEENFVSTGSGSPVAYGLLEEGYKENMSKEEAIALAVKSVNVAIKRDIYTGDGITVYVIDKNSAKELPKSEISAVLDEKKSRK
ncbi:MAG: archaeal proteasome endopeptidase complex subunit beta [Candidatus Nanoarchaeia archaeon]|nr:archaeal proteasome endopeptidase complex subunit beta [Candidatus Nanoarchaeia archaeon]